MSKKQDALKMIEAAFHGLEVIHELTNVGGTKAEGVLVAIRGVLTAIHDGFDGKTTPDIVLAEIESFRHSIAGNDTTVDTELDEKFKGH